MADTTDTPAGTARGSVAVQRTIAAPAERLWDLVADLPSMGRWSPENTGGRWLKGATGPTVGARFRGSNKRGLMRWSTTVTLVAVDRPSVIEWDVTVGPFGVARWGYRFESAGDSTVVTESWTDHRSAVMRTVTGAVLRIQDRATHNRAAMEETLRRLATAPEPG